MPPDPTGRRRPARGGRWRRLAQEWRPSAITLGRPLLPLGVLFGLNAVDELDRTAFAVLLPDIRDHFGLSNAAALTLVAVTTIAIVLIEVPLAFVSSSRRSYAHGAIDRRGRPTST
jgi:branched-chain amino acid transport system ATP-binding protein